MQRFNQHAVGVTRGAEVLFSDFEHDGEMWSGHGPRAVRHPVCFDTPFVSAPVVHVSVNMWDIAGGGNQRADITADRVTPEGFEIVFRTWGDTKVARVRAEWLAIGPIRSDDDWDL